MYSPLVLIISKRRELAVKYKKILKLLNAEAFLVNNLSDAIKEIRENEFEFILISDTIEDNIKDFIKQVRILTLNYRPTIIAISKSDELSDKLTLLNAGADDFMSETMSNREFQARINAHIRRHIEGLVNPLTNFLSEKLTRKILGQLVKTGQKAALLIVSIDKIDYYKEIYGEIAKEKVIQTIAAIISSATTKEDTVGHLSETEFLIFSTPQKSEKLAEFLVFAFDNVIKRFYSEFDYKNSFMMFRNSSKEEKRISLMRLLEAVTEIEKDKFKTAEEIIQSLYNLLKSCRKSEGSSFIIDRPKLYGKVDQLRQKRILIMEQDEALSLLVETSCIINGFSPKVCPSFKNYKECLENFEPDLVILDYGKNKEGLSALLETKEFYKKKDRQAPVVIFSTTFLDKKTILQQGADYYLPKPYDIQTLIKISKDFLN